MEDIIFNAEEIIGKVEKVAEYFINEIRLQYENEDVDNEIFYDNTKKIVELLEKLKCLRQGTFVRVFESAMGDLAIKILEENDEEKIVYVLREDLYNEWAIENGASKLICVCDSLKTLEQKLKETLIEELEEDDNRILEFSSWKIGNMQSIGAMTKYVIDEFCCGRDEIRILIYENKKDYDMGKNNGEIVITKVCVK
jgi:hypothetical protein